MPAFFFSVDLDLQHAERTGNVIFKGKDWEFVCTTFNTATCSPPAGQIYVKNWKNAILNHCGVAKPAQNL